MEVRRVDARRSRHDLVLTTTFRHKGSKAQRAKARKTNSHCVRVQTWIMLRLPVLFLAVRLCVFAPLCLRVNSRVDGGSSRRCAPGLSPLATRGSRGGEVARRREYGEISASTRDRVDRGSSRRCAPGLSPLATDVCARRRVGCFCCCFFFALLSALSAFASIRA